jgi:hypothetical protein
LLDAHPVELGGHAFHFSTQEHSRNFGQSRSRIGLGNGLRVPELATLAYRHDEHAVLGPEQSTVSSAARRQRRAGAYSGNFFRNKSSVAKRLAELVELRVIRGQPKSKWIHFPPGE